GIVSYDSYRTATLEQRVDSEVHELLDQSNYDDLTALNIEIGYDDPVPPRQPTTVTVTVGYPVGVSPPSLAAPLDRRIEIALAALDSGRFGGPGSVRVRVRYVETDSNVVTAPSHDRRPVVARAMPTV